MTDSNDYVTGYILEGLNEKQQKAVIHRDGPCLIISGAGTGKTKVLTHRIAYLINVYNIPPENILALTFTKSATEEMKGRIIYFVGESSPVWIYTFHSLATKILRIELKSEDKQFVIYDSEDQLKVVKNAIKILGFEESEYNVSDILEYISKLKREMISSEEAIALAEDEKSRNIGFIYKQYNFILKNYSAFDFDDLLTQLINLFVDDKYILEKYQERFQYILVDEYHDTCPLQDRLLQMLSDKHRNLFVVGDPDQSIYSWRGATIENILTFEQRYNAKVIKLELNYRSGKNILDAANSLIKHNTKTIPKVLVPARTEEGKIIEYYGANETAEAEYIVKEIQKYHKEQLVPYSEISILYRLNLMSRVYEEALAKAGIPYKIYGGIQFFERQEIKDILAYLKVITYNDKIALHRILNIPPRSLGVQSQLKIFEFIEEQKIDLFEAIHSKDIILTPKSKGSLILFSKMLSEFGAISDSLLVAELIEQILNKTKYLEWLAQQSPKQEAEDRIQNVMELLSIAKSRPDISLREFLDEISLLTLSTESLPDSNDKVNLMTLHNSKGREFSIVFLVGLNEGILPHFSSRENIDELEEERRLCYVGLTRSKDIVYLCRTGFRNVLGNHTHLKSSRFIREILPTINCLS